MNDIIMTIDKTITISRRVRSGMDECRALEQVSR
jgi:hypothetical protein